MHDIDTAFLRTVVTLAETRSFSRTAVLVGRSQSAVSGQIKRLEEIFSRQLIDRDTRNVRLTTDGEKMLAQARAVLTASDAMWNTLGANDLSGEVRFGAPEDFATAYLPDILSSFVNAHPAVLIHVECALTLSLIGRFEAGEFDVAIVKQATDVRHPLARPIKRESLVWIGPDTSVSPNDFEEARAVFGARNRGIPLVLTPSPCVYRSRALAALEGVGAAWSTVFTSPSHAGCVAAVRAGLGYAVVPQTLIPSGLRILDGWPPLSAADLCVLLPPRSTPAAQALVRFIAERLGDVGQEGVDRS